MKILWIVRQDLSCYVFLFRRLTLFYRFTFDHIKAEKSKFLNDFFLSLTAFARVTSFPRFLHD